MKPTPETEESRKSEQVAAILRKDFAALEKRVKGGKPLSAAQRAVLQAQQSGLDVIIPPGGICKSRRECARVLGVAETILRNEWERLPGYPAKNESGARDAGALLAWRDANGKRGAPETPTEISQKARRILLQNEKMEEEIAILKGAHTPNHIVSAALVSFGSSLNAILIQKSNELPALFAGRDIPTIRETLDKVFDEMRQRCQEAIRQWGEQSDAGQKE